ncbi:MAG: GDP-mannose 4,6-dehydratase, partial [Promethearchaeota archaeon]
ISRSFNHTGPGQPDRFVIPSFAKQAVIAEKGSLKRIKVGNVGVIRDFSDVRDVVKAYYSLFQKGKKGDMYNVCSGIGRSLEEILHLLLDKAGVSVDVEVDESLLRKEDIPELVGSNEKIKMETGWKPEIPFSRTLEDMLSYWRKIV